MNEITTTPKKIGSGSIVAHLSSIPLATQDGLWAFVNICEVCQ